MSLLPRHLYTSVIYNQVEMSFPQPSGNTQIDLSSSTARLPRMWPR